MAPTSKAPTPKKAPAKRPPAPKPAPRAGPPAGPATSGKAAKVPPIPKLAVPVKHAADDETEVVVPKLKLEKHGGLDTLCQIEIVKDGHFFIARTITDGAASKEYKNTVFEDLLTEMVITLQEQLADK